MSIDDYYDPPLKPLKTNSSLRQTVRESAERALERAAARLALLDTLPDVNAYPDKTVLLIDRSTSTGRVLTYAALKADGKWWLTGTAFAKPMNGDEFLDWLVSSHRLSVGVVTGVKTLV